jgi:hypothetical protein
MTLLLLLLPLMLHGDWRPQTSPAFSFEKPPKSLISIMQMRIKSIFLDVQERFVRGDQAHVANFADDARLVELNCDISSTSLRSSFAFGMIKEDSPQWSVPQRL